MMVQDVLKWALRQPQNFPFLEVLLGLVHKNMVSQTSIDRILSGIEGYIEKMIELDENYKAYLSDLVHRVKTKGVKKVA